MGLADLHVHSVYSWDGTASVSAILKHVKENTDLHVIAITDHDEIRGALEAQDLAPIYGVEVVPGSEVSSADGHVLALYVDKPIPSGLPLLETIYHIGDLGGLAIIAHPAARGVSSVRTEVLISMFKQPGVSKILVGIEAVNGSLFHRRSNILATALARSLPVACVGNSDSHLLHTIGEIATRFTGHNAAELRTALESGYTELHIGKLTSPMTIASSWLWRYTLRSAGWVAWNAEPSKTIHFKRIKPKPASSQQYIQPHI